VNGVHLQDSSTIGLPAILKEIWKGSGNDYGESAALKIQVFWQYSHGALDGIFYKTNIARIKLLHIKTWNCQQEPCTLVI
jgi:hypothetical protein